MRLREFPRPAAGYIVAVLAAGAAALGLALAALAPPGLGGLALALGLVAGCFALQVRSPVLVWRGSRLALHPDEGLLLVAFLLLPAPLVLVASTLSSVLAQSYLRKPLLKGAFNVSTHALSTVAGGASVALLSAAGVGPLGSVLAVPFVVSASNQLLVALLLILLRSEPWTLVLRPSILQSVGIATVAGMTLGLLSVALHHLHPLALLLLVPAAMLGHRALVVAYHHENELTTRRELNRAAATLLGEPEEEAIARSVLHACRSAFAPLEAGIRLDGPAPREWSVGEAGGPPGTRVAEPLRDESGQAVGELWLRLARKESAQLALDRELVKLVASHLSLALSNARLLSSLRRSERRLREAFDAARDPVVVAARDGRPLYANARALALDGGAGAPAQALWGVLDDASAARLLAAVAAGSTDAPLDLRSRDAGEAQRHFEADVTGLSLDDGTQGCLVVARDVTERRRLEREAERQREALERAERLSALGVLVAGIAHEINNPLTYMRGNVDLVLLDLADLEAALQAQGAHAGGVELPEVRRQLGTVRAGVARIERITKGLKDVASSRAEGALPPLSVGAVLADVERSLASTLPAGVALAVDRRADAVVAGEHAALRLALLNLAKNAIEAVEPRGGRVEVALRAEGGHAVVEVRDDGPGIPAEARAKLFAPFYTTKPDGTGLGLPTAYTIVKSHGGAIEVNSGEGRGATFTVRLPLHAAAAARHA
ncbi:MAG TPA: ATP-binding protein [Candidatus Thermoplasmatota archaeon]|nr:ATP-binding protein [Candidatus Thermoplasmatota archaeon]